MVKKKKEESNVGMSSLSAPLPLLAIGSRVLEVNHGVMDVTVKRRGYLLVDMTMPDESPQQQQEERKHPSSTSSLRRRRSSSRAPIPTNFFIPSILSTPISDPINVNEVHDNTIVQQVEKVSKKYFINLPKKTAAAAAAATKNRRTTSRATATTANSCTTIKKKSKHEKRKHYSTVVHPDLRRKRKKAAAVLAMIGKNDCYDDDKDDGGYPHVSTRNESAPPSGKPFPYPHHKSPRPSKRGDRPSKEQNAIAAAKNKDKDENKKKVNANKKEKKSVAVVSKQQTKNENKTVTDAPMKKRGCRPKNKSVATAATTKKRRGHPRKQTEEEYEPSDSDERIHDDDDLPNKKKKRGRKKQQDGTNPETEKLQKRNKRPRKRRKNSYEPKITYRRWRACGKCLGCLHASNCGRCRPCLVGGQCIQRKCVTPILVNKDQAENFKRPEGRQGQKHSNSSAASAQIVQETGKNGGCQVVQERANNNASLTKKWSLLDDSDDDSMLACGYFDDMSDLEAEQEDALFVKRQQLKSVRIHQKEKEGFAKMAAYTSSGRDETTTAEIEGAPKEGELTSNPEIAVARLDNSEATPELENSMTVANTRVEENDRKQSPLKSCADMQHSSLLSPAEHHTGEATKESKKPAVAAENLSPRVQETGAAIARKLHRQDRRWLADLESDEESNNSEDSYDDLMDIPPPPVDAFM